jgi:hypothetical protein
MLTNLPMIPQKVRQQPGFVTKPIAINQQVSRSNLWSVFDAVQSLTVLLKL